MRERIVPVRRLAADVMRYGGENPKGSPASGTNP